MKFTATRFVATLAIAVWSMTGIAKADTIAGWTFEVSIPTTSGPHAAEVGLGAATGFHSNGLAVYSNPSGNGSVESFSSNFWSVGDFYNFSVSTVGLQNIMISWDQTGSNTGPRDFDLQYNDGSGFVTATSYSLTLEAWSSATYNALSTRTFNFSANTSLNNNSTVQFRLLNTNTTSVNGGTVATTGTGRVDNIVISGSPIPEPATAGFVLLMVAGIAGVRCRS